MERGDTGLETSRVAATEVRDGAWDLQIDLGYSGGGREAVVTACRVLCYEQLVVRDGLPCYGDVPQVLQAFKPRLSMDKLAGVQRFSIRLRKAFADDMPMRVVFGVIVEHEFGDDETRRKWSFDAMYVFTYRNATWPATGPRTAQLVVVDDGYVDVLLGESATVSDFERPEDASGQFSCAELARFCREYQRNPALPELVFERMNTQTLQEILRVHREAVSSE
jgi:hypothetical protein